MHLSNTERSEELSRDELTQRLQDSQAKEKRYKGPPLTIDHAWSLVLACQKSEMMKTAVSFGLGISENTLDELVAHSALLSVYASEDIQPWNGAIVRAPRVEVRTFPLIGLEPMPEHKDALPIGKNKEHDGHVDSNGQEALLLAAKSMRERILELLRHRGSFTLRDVIQELHISRQSASKHVKEIVKKGLASISIDGRAHVYTLLSTGAASNDAPTKTETTRNADTNRLRILVDLMGNIGTLITNAAEALRATLEPTVAKEAPRTAPLDHEHGTIAPDETPEEEAEAAVVGDEIEMEEPAEENIEPETIAEMRVIEPSALEEIFELGEIDEEQHMEAPTTQMEEEAIDVVAIISPELLPPFESLTKTGKMLHAISQGQTRGADIIRITGCSAALVSQVMPGFLVKGLITKTGRSPNTRYGVGDAEALTAALWELQQKPKRSHSARALTTGTDATEDAERSESIGNAIDDSTPVLTIPTEVLPPLAQLPAIGKLLYAVSQGCGASKEIIAMAGCSSASFYTLMPTLVEQQLVFKTGNGRGLRYEIRSIEAVKKELQSLVPAPRSAAPTQEASASPKHSSDDAHIPRLFNAEAQQAALIQLTQPEDAGVLYEAVTALDSLPTDQRKAYCDTFVQEHPNIPRPLLIAWFSRSSEDRRWLKQAANKRTPQKRDGKRLESPTPQKLGISWNPFFAAKDLYEDLVRNKKIQPNSEQALPAGALGDIRARLTESEWSLYSGLAARALSNNAHTNQQNRFLHLFMKAFPHIDQAVSREIVRLMFTLKNSPKNLDRFHQLVHAHLSF